MEIPKAWFTAHEWVFQKCVWVQTLEGLITETWTCTVVVRLLSEVNGASSLEGNETLSPTLPGHRAERSNKWVFSSSSFLCVSHWVKHFSHLILNPMSFFSIAQCIVFITNCSEMSSKKMYLILLNLIFNSVYFFKWLLFSVLELNEIQWTLFFRFKTVKCLKCLLLRRMKWIVSDSMFYLKFCPFVIAFII